MHPGDLRAQLAAVTLGRFEIERELGRGGMGAVFLARQMNLDRRVAIKVLFPHQSADSGLRERFLREARTQSRFDHPNIVPIFDVAEEGGLSYFVMAFVDGPTLRAKLDQEKQPPVAFVARVLKEVGEALAYAHRVGVIHRDIKPENILLDPSSGRALVTDFGIARLSEGAGANVTATFTRIGSPRYMAPEQAESAPDLDGRADQYALGLVGYEMLAGKPAFDAANPAELLYQHKYVEAESLEQLRRDAPTVLRAAIHRAMRKSRDERFPSMDGFIAALEAATPTTIPKQAAKADQLLRWIAIGAGVVVVGVVAVMLVRPKPKPPAPKAVEATVHVDQDTTAIPSRSRGGRTPTARFNGPASVRVADAANFDASSSEDPEDGAFGLEARWDFDQDGRFDTPWSGQKQTNYRYTRPGSYSVLLEVRDSGGQVDRITHPITVEEVAAAPTAAIEVNPAHGPRGTSFRLDASRSSDDYDRPEDLEVRWDFDADGTFDTEWSREKSATRSFEQFGANRVRIEVRDREGRVGTTTQSVMVDRPTDPNELIGILLEAFRTAVEKEDFLNLGNNAYQGEVPPADRDLLKRIFDKAERVTVDPPKPAIDIGRAADTMEARCRLRFRLSASGEPGDLKLRLTFGHTAGRADWKLTRIERD